MRNCISLEMLAKTLYGRSVYTDGALSLCWSLSGFGIRFEAEGAILHFVPDYRADQPVYVLVTLDGRETKYAIVDGKEKILLEHLGEGVHTLEFRRLSEGEAPLKVAALELVGENTSVQEPPALPALRLEFLGDSITCGYGNLAEQGSRVFNTFEEDPTKAYAGLTAAALGADIRDVSISGQGIVKNCNGDIGTPIPVFFHWDSRRGRETHDFTSWVPHAVIVNAGTNDCGGKVTDDEFRAGSEAFLRDIRAQYPDAHIFWAYGLMGLRYDAVLREVIEKLSAADKKMHYVPIRPIWEFPDETGANGHPNVKGHTRGAAVLAEAIREAMKI